MGTGIHQAARAIEHAANAIFSASIQLAEFTKYLQSIGINVELVNAVKESLNAVSSMGVLVKKVTEFISTYGAYGVIGIQAGTALLIGKSLLTAISTYSDNKYKNALAKHIDETLTRLLNTSTVSLQIAIGQYRLEAASTIMKYTTFKRRRYDKSLSKNENIPLDIVYQEALNVIINTEPVDAINLQKLDNYLQSIIGELVKTFDNKQIGNVQVNSLPKCITTSQENLKNILTAISNQTEMKFIPNHDDVFHISYKTVSNLYKNVDGLVIAIKDECKDIFNEINSMVLSYPFNPIVYLEEIMFLIGSAIKSNDQIFIEKLIALEDPSKNTLMQTIYEIFDKYKEFREELLLTKMFSKHNSETQADMFYVVFMKAMLDLCNENIAPYLHFPYNFLPQVKQGIYDTVNNSYNMVRHPIDTVSNMFTAVIHPINTIQSIASMAWYQPTRMGASLVLSVGTSKMLGSAIAHVNNHTPGLIHQTAASKVGSELHKIGVHSKSISALSQSHSVVQNSNTISSVPVQAAIQASITANINESTLDCIGEKNVTKRKNSHQVLDSEEANILEKNPIEDLIKIIGIAESFDKISSLLEKSKVYPKENKSIVEIIFNDISSAKDFQNTLITIGIEKEIWSNRNKNTEGNLKNEFKLILSKAEFNFIKHVDQKCKNAKIKYNSCDIQLEADSICFASRNPHVFFPNKQPKQRIKDKQSLPNNVISKTI